MFSTNKNRKIGMLIFLFVVSFIVGMLINIQRLGSLPMKASVKFYSDNGK